MTAKAFIIMTFGGFVAMAVFVLLIVLLGVTWRGGNEGMAWIFLAASVLTSLSYLMYRQKWPPALTGARYLLAVERGLTIEEAMEICRKYSFLMLISAGIFLVAAIVAFFTY